MSSRLKQPPLKKKKKKRKRKKEKAVTVLKSWKKY